MNEEQFYSEKESTITSILGPMHDTVMHAVIPYSVGGSVDIHFFPNTTYNGTALITMEMILAENGCQLSNTLGNFEFILFSKMGVDSILNDTGLVNRVSTIFTNLGRLSCHEKLEPGETCEVPYGDNGKMTYVLFDEYQNGRFSMNNKNYGLLLVIELFESEMRYAIEHGSSAVIAELKKRNFYPYSNIEREPVF